MYEKAMRDAGEGGERGARSDFASAWLYKTREVLAEAEKKESAASE